MNNSCVLFTLPAGLATPTGRVKRIQTLSFVVIIICMAEFNHIEDYMFCPSNLSVLKIPKEVLAFALPKGWVVK